MGVKTLYAILIVISSIVGIYANYHFLKKYQRTPLRTYILGKTAILGYVIFIYGCFLFDTYVYDLVWFEASSFPYFAWPLVLAFTVTYTLDAWVRRAEDK